MPSDVATIGSREPGAPVSKGTIPLCVPHLGGNEWTYVKECLDTNFVSSVGPFVERFEQAVARCSGARHGVAVVNGTAAIHIALQVIGVEAGDEVIMPSLTFVAPANAVRYLGAWPVFLDVDPEYWELSPARLAEFLREECTWVNGTVRNRHTGRRVRAVLPVHVLGHPVDLDPIMAIAREFGLAVIEDATESIGAEYRARPLGALADIGCFSFNGNKLLTTGGGGAIVTNNEAFAVRAKYLTTQAKDDSLEFVHGEVGYNYRLSNVLAAIGVAQVERLNDHLMAKRRIAERYSMAFGNLVGVTPMREAPWARSAFWMYTICIDAETFGMDSRGLLRELEGKGVMTRPLWQPLHLSPAHAGAFSMPCVIAERLNANALSLPCSVGLTDMEQDLVIKAVRTVGRGI